jgi:hypothetical protein
MRPNSTALLGLCAGFIGGILASQLVSTHSVAAQGTHFDRITVNDIEAKHLRIVRDPSASTLYPKSPGIVVSADGQFPGILIQGGTAPASMLRLESSDHHIIDVGGGMQLRFGNPNNPSTIIDDRGIFLKQGTEQVMLSLTGSIHLQSPSLQLVSGDGQYATFTAHELTIMSTSPAQRVRLRVSGLKQDP